MAANLRVLLSLMFLHLETQFSRSVPTSGTDRLFYPIPRRGAIANDLDPKQDSSKLLFCP
jgi:hypothetical protein